jgi:histidine triad (HIT) family protein
MAGVVLRAYYNMGDCIFCRIVDGSAKAEVIFRDEQVTAFRDIHPAAPKHILVVPNKHIPSLNEISQADEPLIGHLFSVVRQIAEQEGIAEEGYRLIINTGTYAGQVVPHLHLHLLGGGHLHHRVGWTESSP